MTKSAHILMWEWNLIWSHPWMKSYILMSAKKGKINLCHGQMPFRLVQSELNIYTQKVTVNGFSRFYTHTPTIKKSSWVSEGVEGT